VVAGTLSDTTAVIGNDPEPALSEEICTTKIRGVVEAAIR